MNIKNSIIALTILTVGAFYFTATPTQPEIKLPDYSEYVYSTDEDILTIRGDITIQLASDIGTYLVRVKDINKPLLIHMESTGGSIEAANLIVTMLKSYKRPVVFYVSFAASSAAYITQQFQNVYCSEFGRFMMHNIKRGYNKYIQAGEEVVSIVDDLHRLNEVFLTASLRRATVKGRKIIRDEFIPRERNIYTDDAIKWGLCNKVMYPRYKVLSE